MNDDETDCDPPSGEGVCLTGEDGDDDEVDDPIPSMEQDHLFRPSTPPATSSSDSFELSSAVS